MPLTLVTPAHEHLPAYVEALERGWSPDTTAGGEATRLTQLAKISLDPDLFLAGMDDPEAKAGDVRLPDGTMVPRLPGIVRWMWDGGFLGAINFRWKDGTELLPPTCSGHIGYSVVPWARARGHATRALGLLLPEVPRRGLRWIHLVTNPDNIASQRVIEANGGVLVRQFTKPDAYGGGEALLWKITV